MNTKNLIILIVLFGLGVGGFFVWKNFSFPDEEKAKEEKTEEEIYIYKGIWLPGIPPIGWLTSNIPKMKELGMNTVFLSVGFLKEEDNRLAGIDTSHIVEDIQIAHDNGLKVALTTGFRPPYPKLEDLDLEVLNSLIIEVAELAEEYDVELFAPLNEPGAILEEKTGKKTGEWRQEILLKIKEVYHGEIVWKGTGIGSPDKILSEEYLKKLSESPPGDFSGYDYIGFTTLFVPSEGLTLEEYSQYIDNALKYGFARAERDNCKGIMLTEFGMGDRFVMRGSDVVDLIDDGTITEEEFTRAHEIVFEKGKDMAVGFITTIDVLETEIETEFFEVHIRGIPETEELIREWFKEIL